MKLILIMTALFLLVGCNSSIKQLKPQTQVNLSAPCPALDEAKAKDVRELIEYINYVIFEYGKCKEKQKAKSDANNQQSF